MNRFKFFPYFIPIINLSAGILCLSSLPYNKFSYNRLFIISLCGIFILVLNLYYNKHISLRFKDRALKLFTFFSIFVNFSIIPSLLFYTQFDFISYKFLNYFLLLIYPICSTFALVYSFFNDKNIIFNNLLAVLLYIFAIITLNKNLSNILPVFLIILVSMIMVWESFKKNFLDYFK